MIEMLINTLHFFVGSISIPLFLGKVPIYIALHRFLCQVSNKSLINNQIISHIKFGPTIFLEYFIAYNGNGILTNIRLRAISFLCLLNITAPKSIYLSNGFWGFLLYLCHYEN